MRSDPTSTISLGAAIHELRKARALTLRQLAVKLNVSHVFICDLEHNRRRIPKRLMRQLAIELGTTPRYLEGLTAFDKLPEWLRANPAALKLLKRIQRERRLPGTAYR